ncbi:MAG: psaB [Bacteroidota bacterium]|nr:psaB [Bacteroidota bacterium]
MKKTFFLCCMSLTLLCSAKKWDATYIAKLIASGGIDKVIEYYQQKYYSPNRDPQDAFKIAELYVKKKDYQTAMQWYDKEGQLINTSKVNLFNYANTNRLMGEYQKALDGYLMYAALTGDVAKVMDYANQCEQILKASAQADNYKFENYTYNTLTDEIILTVLRTNPIYAMLENGSDGKPVYNLLQVVRDFQNFAEPAKVTYGTTAQLKITDLTYTRDGNMVAFSVKEKSKNKGAKEIEKIFIADNLGGNFLKIKPFPFNSDLNALKHPAFNSDGTVLYFSSDLPGGSGGFDIWKSVYQNGRWMKPVNLGKLLNSKEDDISPFIVQDTKDNTIYFSSEREGGFGGFDIYAAKNIDDVWQAVEMQPAPINSAGDDISVIYDNEINTGYVSSNRRGGKGGFDVYRFTPFNLRIIVSTNDSATGKAIDYALVQLNEKELKVNESVTNENGKTSFQVGKDKTFTLNISKDNYRPVTINLNTNGKISGDSVEANISLKQDAQFSIQKGATNNLSMDNYIIFTGQIIDGYTNKPARTSKMRMVNYTTKKLRELDIDEDGRFQIKLLMNNSYKVIIENADSRITDELTTYGLDKLDVKVRDYLISGTKFKLTVNKVYKPDNLPPTVKLRDLNAPIVSLQQVDSLVKTISKNNTTSKKSTSKSVSKASVKPAPKTVEKPVVTEKKKVIKHIDTLAKAEQTKPDTIAKIVQQKTEIKTQPVQNTTTNKPVANKPSASSTTTPSLEQSIAEWKEKVKKEGIPEPGADILKSKPTPKPKKQTKVKEEEIKTPPGEVIINVQETPALVEETPKINTSPEPVVKNTSSPAVDNVVHPDIYYKIQLGSYPDATITFPEFQDMGKVETIQSYGQYIYRLGDIYSLDDAKAMLDKVRNKGYYVAFILQYNKNKVTGIVK